MTRHHLFDPDGLAPSIGFSYGVVAGAGKTLHISGMTGHKEDGSIEADLVDQFTAACRSVVRVISEAGGEASDLVSMIIYTTDIAQYRSRLGPIGEGYRSIFGRHYPAMALFGVDELFDPNALVELVCVAVVPGQ